MDNKIIYYYRNGYSTKVIAEKTGLTVNQVSWRIRQIKKKRPLLRWWEEEPDYMFAWGKENK